MKSLSCNIILEGLNSLNLIQASSFQFSSLWWWHPNLQKKPRSVACGLSVGHLKFLRPLVSNWTLFPGPSAVELTFSPPPPDSSPWNHIEPPFSVFIDDNHLNVSFPSPFLYSHTVLVSPLRSLGSIYQPHGSSPSLPPPALCLCLCLCLTGLAPRHALLSPQQVVLPLAFLPFIPSSTFPVIFLKHRSHLVMFFLECLQWGFHVLEKKHHTIWFPQEPQPPTTPRYSLLSKHIYVHPLPTRYFPSDPVHLFSSPFLSVIMSMLYLHNVLRFTKHYYNSYHFLSIYCVPGAVLGALRVYAQ